MKTMIKLFKKEFLKLKLFFSNPIFWFLTIFGNSTMVATTAVVYYLEKDTNPKMQTYFDALWWGLSTITTIGYGDIIPITTSGRIIGMLLMFFGTVLFVTFTGVLVSFWMQETLKKEMHPLEKEMMKEEILQGELLKEIKNIEKRLGRLESNLKK